LRPTRCSRSSAMNSKSVDTSRDTTTKDYVQLQHSQQRCTRPSATYRKLDASEKSLDMHRDIEEEDLGHQQITGIGESQMMRKQTPVLKKRDAVRNSGIPGRNPSDTPDNAEICGGQAVMQTEGKTHCTRAMHSPEDGNNASRRRDRRRMSSAQRQS
jgi:hypothetical protein